MGEQFPHIVSAAGKKLDIGRYLGRLGRYLKQESMDTISEGECGVFPTNFPSAIELIMGISIDS